MILFAKQKQRHRCREQMYGSQGGRRGGRNWEIGSDTYTLLILCIKQITNENVPYSRGPQTAVCGPAIVHGLGGTGLHSRRRAVGERVKLHLPLPIAPHRSHYRLNKLDATPRPGPWKNCLPRNRSLVPKRLGTAGVQHRELCLTHCGDLMGRKSEKEGIYVYVQLIHFAVQQKRTQHCKATILQ